MIGEFLFRLLIAPKGIEIKLTAIHSESYLQSLLIAPKGIEISNSACLAPFLRTINRTKRN